MEKLDPPTISGINGLDYEVSPQSVRSLSVCDDVTIIVNAQHKGGVGKTTDTLLQATFLADELNKRVLLIDLDKQANLSGCFLRMELESDDRSYSSDKAWKPPVHPEYPDYQIGDGRYSFAEMFRMGEDGEAVGLIPYPTDNPNIDVVPAYSSVLSMFHNDTELYTQMHSHDPDFADKVRNFAGNHETRDVFREEVRAHIVKALLNLKAAISELNANPETRSLGYDYIIFDTPPDKNLFIDGCIRAADHVVFAFYPDTFTFDGMISMKTMLDNQNLARAELGLESTGYTIQPNKIDGRLKSQLRDLDRFAARDPHRINIPIRTHEALRGLIGEKPDTVSYVNKFGRSSKEFQNISAAMRNLFSEELK